MASSRIAKPSVTLSRAMREDDSIFIMGEDIAEMGGSMGVTRGCSRSSARSGCGTRPSPRWRSWVPASERRCRDAARRRDRVQDFLTLSLEQIVNQAAKHRYMSGGQLKVPLVIRTQGGAGCRRARSTRSSSRPGSATSRSEGRLPVDADRRPRPPGRRSTTTTRPSSSSTARSTGSRRTCRTRWSRSSSARRASTARARTSPSSPPAASCTSRSRRRSRRRSRSVSVEVVDPRTLQPLDEGAIVDSVKKTNRCVVAHEAVTRMGRRGDRGDRPAPGLRLARRAGRACRREVRAAPVRAGDGGVRRATRRRRPLRDPHDRGMVEWQLSQAPRLGQGMESGTIVKWLKSEGEPVQKGEALYELDTEKVTQEVEAEASGVLLKIAVQEGEVEVGRTVAIIGEEGEQVSVESADGDGGPPGTEAVDEEPAEEGSRAPERDEERERGREASAPAAGRCRARRAASTAGSRLRRSRAGSRASAASTSAASTAPAPRAHRRGGRRARGGGPAPTLPPRARPRASRRSSRSPRRGGRSRGGLRSLAGAGLPAQDDGRDDERAGAARGLVGRMREVTKPTVNDVLTRITAAALVRHPAVNTSPATRSGASHRANVGIAVAAPQARRPRRAQRRPPDDRGDRRRAVGPRRQGP